MSFTKRQAYESGTEPDVYTADNEAETYEWTSDPEVAVERLRKQGVEAYVSDAEVVIYMPYTKYLEQGSLLIENFGKTLNSIGYGCVYGIDFVK